MQRSRATRSCMKKIHKKFNITKNSGELHFSLHCLIEKFSPLSETESLFSDFAVIF